VSTETTDTQTSTRTFYRADYKRMARVIQRMRHVKGDRCTAKPQDAQNKITYLAMTMSQYFDQDAPEGAFDAGKFMAGTQLPQAHQDITDEDLPEGAYEVE
jgi:hypothetical protein